MASDKTADSLLAADICGQFKLSPEAAELLKPQQKAGEFFSLLVREQQLKDAIRFAAYWLPKRQAVWWGCLCLWHGLRPNPDEKIEQALRAAVQWVQEPSEETRRAAEAAGRAAGVAKPAASVALAAFYSGGSISLPDQPEVLPKPTITAKNVSNALLLAAKKLPPKDIETCYRQYLVLATEVMGGKLTWESPQASAAAMAKSAS